MMKSSDILIGARNYIVKHGWIQGHLGNADGPACLIGSVHFSSKSFANINEREDAYEYIYKVGILDEKSLAIWNDFRFRTLEEVLNLLDEAASMALSEEAVK